MKRKGGITLPSFTKRHKWMELPPQDSQDSQEIAESKSSPPAQEPQEPQEFVIPPVTLSLPTRPPPQINRPSYNWNEEQKRAWDWIHEGKNVYISGPAGTGKSYLFKLAIQDFLKTYPPGTVFVTSLTGVSAIEIGGTTLHSFAGISGNYKPAKEYCQIIRRFKKQQLQNWIHCRVLFIDEISMLNAQTLDLLNEIAQLIREDYSFFGGIQVIVTGDFLQLPPIQGRFAFFAQCWRNFHCIELCQVYRQKDPMFVEVLNEMRLGSLSERSLEYLNQFVRPPGEGQIPIRIYAYRTDVEDENKRRLNLLPSEALPPYEALDDGEEQALKECRAPKTLELKRGCRVMLVCNLDQKNGLVNGAQGEVIGFEPNERGGKYYPIVQFDQGMIQKIQDNTWTIQDGKKIRAIRIQLPLCLAYAITVHKAQGLTLKEADIRIRNTFSKSQMYVAVSRVQGPEGLFLAERVEPRMIQTHPEAVAFIKSLRGISNTEPDLEPES